MLANNQTRSLSAYEKNQLAKYGIAQEVLLASEAPVEYITGYVDFFGREFMVDKSVLIPRVETEELIDLALEEIANLASGENKPLEILDMGTGSGAIGLTLYLESLIKNIRANFTLSDISLLALQTARKNFEKLVVKNTNTQSIQFVKSDLFSELDKNKKFDLIVANLPYVPSSRIGVLESSVKDFEPHLALDGGVKGLEMIERFLVSAENYISKNGVIILEIDESHTLNDLEKIIEMHQLNFSVQIILDQLKNNRFVVVKVV